MLAYGILTHHPVLVADRRVTPYPASSTPDQIVLTWSGDPETTQTVQWRTTPAVRAEAVRYRPVAGKGDKAWREVQARTFMLEDPYLVNDPKNTRYTATLEGLTPGATYAYQVGGEGAWSPEATFTTAPANGEGFTFIYLGDAQIGLTKWGDLLHATYKRHPEAAFYLIAGDLVNNGGERNDWDLFMHGTAGVFDQRPMLAVIGNHDDDDTGSPRMYLDLFAFPENGPDTIDPERAYSFEYTNALFVMLDSNAAPSTQTAWLKATLAGSDAKWKFVMYHHPAYSPKAHRDNEAVRDEWSPLFDAYHVDLALQGHDHSYMRTYPIRNSAVVDGAANGTTYVVSVSGEKHYGQVPNKYAAVEIPELSTYQVIDIRGNRLTYRAYDVKGKVVDEFTIEK